MNPLVGIRWRPPKELSLHFLEGMLCHVGQDEAQLVGQRRQRTGVIRRVAAACAGLPINGSVLHRRHQRRLEMGQQRREFYFC
jgi:hypothetical protein